MFEYIYIYILYSCQRYVHIYTRVREWNREEKEKKEKR